LQGLPIGLLHLAPRHRERELQVLVEHNRSLHRQQHYQSLVESTTAIIRAGDPETLHFDDVLTILVALHKKL